MLAQLDPDGNMSPIDALLDANRRMVAVVREATRQIESGETPTLEQLHRLTELLKAQAHIGRTCVDAGVELKIVASMTVNSEVLANALDAALGALDSLGLDHSTRLALEDEARRRAIAVLDSSSEYVQSLPESAPERAARRGMIVGEVVTTFSDGERGHIPMPMP